MLGLPAVVHHYGRTEIIVVAWFYRPQFRFTDHITALDDDQPKKMLLKRDPDSYEVRACSLGDTPTSGNCTQKNLDI